MNKQPCFSMASTANWPIGCMSPATRRRRWGGLAVACLAAAALALPLPDAAAQNVVFLPTGTDDYAVNSNWDTGVLPDADFGESAFINNGATAFVDSAVAFFPGGVVLGQGAGDSGSLEIRSGGDLTTAISAMMGNTTGTVVVGQGGEGHLTVLRGGTLTAAGALSSGGSAASSIVLGETGGAGTATLNVGGASNLGRTTRIIGPNVSYTTAGLNLGADHNLIAQITGPAHSAISSTGNATLGGKLTLQFDGVTPGPGDSWQIVDASGITGSFSSVSINTPVTEPGFAYFIETVGGGANGRVAQVSVDARLMLSVDRGTGAASLTNLTTSEMFDLDGYLITSADGRLDPGGWSSFQGAGQANWEEANPTSNSLSELNLDGSRMIGPGQSVSLGNILTPPAQLGVEEDLAFTYNIPGAGPEVGVIDYTGPINNLVLVVDPDSGEAFLQNQSAFDIDIDGYEIISNAASLDPSGWTSLADGGTAGWEEANPTGNAITELNLDSSTLLAGRSNAISLGTIFDTAAEKDLVFNYNMTGVGPMLGVVDYGLPVPPDMGGGPDGDYNNNGTVEQADLDLVLLNWGKSFDTLPPEWVNERPTSGIVSQAQLDGVLLNWGNTAALGAAAGVPEPSTAALLAIAAAFVLGVIRKR